VIAFEKEKYGMIISLDSREMAELFMILIKMMMMMMFHFASHYSMK
jgi:hypothetical protein